MLDLVDKGTAHTCDGVTRRKFLQAGTLSAIGLALPELLAARARGNVADGHDERSVHHDLQPRRAQPDGLLGHEARRAGRDSRAVQARSRPTPPAIQISEILPLHGPARRQVFAGA